MKKILLLFPLTLFAINLKSTYLIKSYGNKYAVIAKSSLQYKVEINKNIFIRCKQDKKSCFIIKSLQFALNQKELKSKSYVIPLNQTEYVKYLTTLTKDLKIYPFKEQRIYPYKSFFPIIGKIKYKKENNIAIVKDINGLEGANNSRGEKIYLNLYKTLQNINYYTLNKNYPQMFAEYAGKIAVMNNGKVIYAVSNAKSNVFTDAYFTYDKIKNITPSKASELPQKIKKGYMNILQFIKYSLPSYNGGEEVNIRFFKRTPLRKKKITQKQIKKIKRVIFTTLENGDELKINITRIVSGIELSFIKIPKKMLKRTYKNITVYAEANDKFNFVRIKGSKFDKQINKYLSDIPKDFDFYSYRILTLNDKYLSVVYIFKKFNKHIGGYQKRVETYFLGKNINLQTGKPIKNLQQILYKLSYAKALLFINKYMKNHNLQILQLNNFAFSNDIYLFIDTKKHDKFSLGEYVLKIPQEFNITAKINIKE